ncbi:MAG TPA: GNAT family N-acetyltransferase [Mycobacteriales bacterium]|nr:GNAT family N-acetyltransferase [Mycobacteriales bacterium]
MTINAATQATFPEARAVARRSLYLDEPEGGDLVDLLAARPANITLLAEDPGVRGIAMGAVDGAKGHVDLLAVDPAHQRQGYGRQLLRALEEQLITAGARELWIGGSVDRYAWPGVDVRYTPALCLIEAAGYRKVQDAVNMTVDLRTAPLDTAAPPGLDVRRLDPSERDAFAAWMTRWGGSWPAEAGRAAAFDVPRVHVASDETGYLGFAAHGANRAGWFGPMGTDEAARGRGIGAVLLRRCLADQRDAGLTHAEIGWVGPVPFYSKAVGAYVDRVCWLYRRDIS